jgi:virginiamycin B lyase
MGLALALPPGAEAYVYWDNWGGDTGTTIGRANLNGGGVKQSFIKGASGPCGVAVDGGHVYWTNGGNLGSGTTIGRAKLNGTGVDQSFITGATGPCGVAVDLSHVYWANDNGTIGRAKLNGAGVDQSFINGANHPLGVAVDSRHIYWANTGGTTIGRAKLNGTGVDQSFITGLSEPINPAVDSGHIYWARGEGSTIGRAKLNGGGVDQTFINGNEVGGVAVDSGHIYWGNEGGGAMGTIGRAKLNGGGVDQSFISGANEPLGVAVDSLPTTKTTLHLHKTRARVKASGEVTPGDPGVRMTVKLARKSGRRFRTLRINHPRLDSQSSYSTSFKRPSGGTCKATAKFPGDAVHKPSSKSTRFGC